MWRRRTLLAALLAALVIAAGILVGIGLGSDRAGPVGAADIECDEVTMPADDLAEFFDRLDPGETGCLREGTHTVAGTVAVASPDVTVTSYPGEAATLVGHLWIQEGADRTVVEDLSLVGRNEEKIPSPTVNADDVVFRGNDVTNEHTGICFVIGDDRYGEAEGTVIEDNRIHDCGRLPATNHDHGIYVAHARGTVIRDNAIYANADRGVQLYPDSQEALVTGNVIVGNGQGVSFGGSENSTSNDNLVEGNLITGSILRYNIESHWQGDTGGGNVARENCVWTTNGDYEGDPEGSGVQPSMDGADAFDNLVTEPDFNDSDAADFRLNGESDCASPSAAVP